MKIRRLSYSDLPRVISLEKRAFPAPWSLSMFVLELAKPGSICLGLEDEELIGYLICSRYDTVWHVMNIAVSEPYRGKGLGSQLLERLLSELADDEAQVTLEVRSSNTAAIKLYERFAFKAVGVRPGYYGDNGEDAVIMWRTAETVREHARAHKDSKHTRAQQDSRVAASATPSDEQQ